jgi:hypothetical protein
MRNNIGVYVKKIKSSILVLCALSALTTACINVEQVLHVKEKKKSNRVTNTTANVNQVIGDDEVKLQVISESAFKDGTLNKSLLPLSNSKVMKTLSTLPQGEPAESINEGKQELKAQEESLHIGFPISLIGEQNVFGGVITKVSDKENESLGVLKLTDLSPIHVRTIISFLPNGNPALTLIGCFNECDENSEPQALINFPVVGFNESSAMLIVDMAAIGRELDLISMLDPQGEYTKLKTIFTTTSSVEYDLKTLIFDIKTIMIPVAADPKDPMLQMTEFTVRWYLKLGSGFNPAFTPRDATKGVGFFKTSRSSKNKITRFSTTDNGTDQGPVKYYIKNVPTEFKKTFAKAMDSWNVEFKKTIGKDLLSYEFIDATDPKADFLTPGDIRYNIIEWDLVNKAGYGGLGPSIANQYTGETMSANVLIQGPTIVKLYTEWFKVSKKAEILLAEGKNSEANKLIKDFNVSVSKDMESRTEKTFNLKLGKHLDMTIHAQKAELEDPIIKGHFELVPAGMTYEKYMEGYMMEIVAHEVGHNLGLRHNFKGNLGSYENNAEPGSVSRSVMEYLGRPYRHLNTIGNYDRMAIAYAYNGSAPKHLDWFCTDEDQGNGLTLDLKSPECTKSDATSDPFSFFEGRLNRVIDLVLETKSDSAPVWTVKEVTAQIDEAVTGLAAYALSARNTADSWTNFFGKNDRPDNKTQIKGYVLERFKKKLCNPELAEVIASKTSAESRNLAEANLVELTQAIVAKATSLGFYKAKDFGCGE